MPLISGIKNTLNIQRNEPVTTLKQLISKQSEMSMIVADLQEISESEQLSTIEKIETLNLQNQNILARNQDDRVISHGAKEPVNEGKVLKKIQLLTDLKEFIDTNSELINQVHKLRHENPKTEKRIFRAGYSQEVTELVDVLTREPISSNPFIGKREQFEKDREASDAADTVAVQRKHAYIGTEEAVEAYSAEAQKQAFGDFERDARIFINGQPVIKPDTNAPNSEKMEAFQSLYDFLKEELKSENLSEAEIADFFMEISQAGVAEIIAVFRKQFANSPQVLENLDEPHELGDPFVLMAKAGGGTQVFIDTKEKTVTIEFETNRGLLGSEAFTGSFKGTRVYYYTEGKALTTIDEAILESNSTGEKVDIHPNGSFE